MLNEKEQLLKLLKDHQIYLNEISRIGKRIIEILSGENKQVFISNQKIGVIMPPPPPAELTGKRWSEQYDACIKCGGTEHRHRARGLCSFCWTAKRANILKRGGSIEDFPTRQKTKSNNQIRTERQYGDAPGSSAASNFECGSCGEKFRSVLDIEDIICPGCSGKNILQIN